METSIDSALGKSANAPFLVDCIRDRAGLIPQSVFDNAGGVIREIMDYTLSTSPYPNPPLALAGAISLLSLLCGRRFRCGNMDKTNLYIIGLGESGVGKDAARQTNKILLSKIGMSTHLADMFGSEQALEDALLKDARLLMQYDEIDSLIIAMKKDPTGSREGIGRRLKNLFSEKFLQRRRLTGSKIDTSIADECHLPSMTLYGTAVTSMFASNITRKMMVDGLFGRCLFVDAGKRGEYNKNQLYRGDVPEKLIAELKSIAGFSPIPDGWEANKPAEPSRLIEIFFGEGAEETADRYREEYDRKSEESEDDAEITHLRRMYETVLRLAMLHTVSRNPKGGKYLILPEDIIWGHEFANAAHHFAITLTTDFSAENLGEENRKRVCRVIKRAKGEITRAKLYRYSKLSAKELAEALETLLEAEIVSERVEQPNARHAKPVIFYSRGKSFYEV